MKNSMFIFYFNNVALSVPRENFHFAFGKLNQLDA